MRQEKFIPLFSILAGVVLLLLPAFYNGYPLVNADDGTYIASGFKLETPFDRPITYGLFLRVFSLNGLSFWIAVAVQAVLFSFLIVRLIQRAGAGKMLWRYSLITFSILACTSASWTVSQIIPDIWTGIALLALTLIIRGQENKGTRLFLFCLYTIAVATHMSNILILTGVLALLFLFRRYFFVPAALRRVHWTMLLTMLLTWATFAVMGAAYAKSKNIFMMASLLEKGILKQYLNEYCPQKQYDICQYQQELPADPNVFLWEANSPVYKAGGWEATREEYGRITGDIFSKPRYVGMFLRQSAYASWQQFFTCHLAEGNFPFPPGTDVHLQVAQSAPLDVSLYEKASQHQSQNIVRQLTVLNYLYYAITIAGLLVLICFLLFYRKQMSPFLRLSQFILLSGYVVNVVDCATFAQVNARFGSRLLWVMPLGAALCVINYLGRKWNRDTGINKPA